MVDVVDYVLTSWRFFTDLHRRYCQHAYRFDDIHEGIKAKNLAKRLIPHSCIMKSIINKYNSLINETERELLDVGDPLNHQKNTKNKRKSKSQIPECSKKRKKLRRNSSRPPSMESDSYFEKSFCIMITSSDLYGSCSSEEIKPDFLFDSFGNKIFI